MTFDFESKMENVTVDVFFYFFNTSLSHLSREVDTQATSNNLNSHF